MLALSQQLFNVRCKEKLDLLWQSSDAHEMMIDTIIDVLKDMAGCVRSTSLEALVKAYKHREMETTVMVE